MFRLKPDLLYRTVHTAGRTSRRPFLTTSCEAVLWRGKEIADERGRKDCEMRTLRAPEASLRAALSVGKIEQSH